MKDPVSNNLCRIRVEGTYAPKGLVDKFASQGEKDSFETDE